MIPNTICLNPDYSTTRLLIRTDSLSDIKPSRHFESAQLSSSDSSQKIEGGLRTKGYFKTAFEDKPLISVVTVVFNGQEYLEETIKSVISQTYDNVEYIIIDGGSNDRTLQILRQYEDVLDYWISEKDNGMYDAIHKGFSLCCGSILAWLNADDIYYPYALSIVSQVFTRHQVEWVTGVASLINQHGSLVDIEPPKCYFRFLIEQGYYRHDYLGFIQQESTFFSRSLYFKHPLDRTLKMAGDYNLWTQFAKSSVLYTVRTLLASFRVHAKQQSVQLQDYKEECEKISSVRKFKMLKYIFKPLGLLGIPKNQLIKPISWDKDFMQRISRIYNS